MKFIKKFESFHETGVDDAGGEKVPKYNPHIRKLVSDYIDELPIGSRPIVFKWLRIEAPKTSDPEFDKKFDEAKDFLIKYFEENPNLDITKININNFTIPKRGSNVIPKVQNIGSTSQTNSFRIGQ